PIPCISSRMERWKSSSSTSVFGSVPVISSARFAALRRTRRSATVTAVTRTSLLVLDAHDLRVLMDRETRIAERIHEVARTRRCGEALTPKGDLVAEELEEVETLHPSVRSRSRS